MALFRRCIFPGAYYESGLLDMNMALFRRCIHCIFPGAYYESGATDSPSPLQVIPIGPNINTK